MFAHEEVLSVIFRLVNFGILSFICVYLFRRYILPAIKDQMHSKQDERRTIKERHKEIYKQEAIVIVFAQDQEKLCKVLKEKVNHWRYVQEDHEQKRSDEKERRMRFLLDRTMRQEKEFEHQQMLHVIVPRAVDTVAHIVREKFKAPEQGHMYINDIIEKLRKERI